MIMKKIQFLTASAAIAAMMLTACTDKVDFAQEDLQAAAGTVDDNSIQFGTYLNNSAATRAGQAGSINTAKLKEDGYGFGVFAYYTGTQSYNDYTSYEVPTAHGKTGQTTQVANFMFNQKVKWDASRETAGYITAWEYSPIKYWPNEVTNDATAGVDDQDNDADKNPATASGDFGGNLTFFAYAPYVEMDNSTALKEKGNKTGIIWINNKGTLNGANAVKTDPILTYLVDEDGSKVVDLLWGTYGNTSVNVNGGETNKGVSYKSSADGGTVYQQSILEYKDSEGKAKGGYTLNADLTKQKTNGTVDFAFKHALAKVGGSTIYTSTPGSSDKLGFMVVLDIDDMKGAESGGSKDNVTKVTISDITVKARTLVADSEDDEPGSKDYQYTYLKEATGEFNLATGHWFVLKKGNTTITPDDATNHAATTTHRITTDGIEGKLNTTIAEPTSKPAATAEGFNGLPEGVLTTPKNVYAEEAYPLVYIPETWPELTVTVTYIVRTADPNLAGAYSDVKQTITKRVTFKDAVELNKQYSLLMHLGLTSVKFTAEVSNWEIDNDDPNYDSDNDGTVDIEVTDVYVPINVATAAGAVSAAKSFEYTASTAGSDEYTYFYSTVTGASMTVTGSTIEYVMPKDPAFTDKSGGTTGTPKLLQDLGRFLGALWRADNGTTVSSIKYKGKTYKWFEELGLKGSNWAENAEMEGSAPKTSLIKALRTDFASLATTSITQEETVTLYINGIEDADHTITLKVKITV